MEAGAYVHFIYVDVWGLCRAGRLVFLLQRALTYYMFVRKWINFNNDFID